MYGGLCCFVGEDNQLKLNDVEVIFVEVDVDSFCWFEEIGVVVGVIEEGGILQEYVQVVLLEEVGEEEVCCFYIFFNIFVMKLVIELYFWLFLMWLMLCFFRFLC